MEGGCGHVHPPPLLWAVCLHNRATSNNALGSGITSNGKKFSQWRRTVVQGESSHKSPMNKSNAWHCPHSNKWENLYCPTVPCNADHCIFLPMQCSEITWNDCKNLAWRKKKLVFYHMLPLMMNLTVFSSSWATFIAKEFRKIVQPSPPLLQLLVRMLCLSFNFIFFTLLPLHTPWDTCSQKWEPLKYSLCYPTEHYKEVRKLSSKVTRFTPKIHFVNSQRCCHNKPRGKNLLPGQPIMGKVTGEQKEKMKTPTCTWDAFQVLSFVFT